jgi:alpha-glucuronidase
MKRVLLLLIVTLVSIQHNSLQAENGYRLWLRYDLISNSKKLQEYRQFIKGYFVGGQSPTLSIVSSELQNGLTGLLGQPFTLRNNPAKASVVAALPSHASLSSIQSKLNDQLKTMDHDGFLILSASLSGAKTIVITAKSEAGILYGTFHFLKLLQTHQTIENLTIESAPKIQLRILNHWDNLDRTVERGYAGFSLWDWHKLPDFIDTRYRDYARVNASIGINGTVLTNVNANALILTAHYLEKVKALADVFRPYGIKVYLTARFSAPMEIGGLKTADPLDSEVQRWWKNKITEIYTFIPDFGGMVVKANSEGQPGPQNYGRTHADGANMLADALLPYNGIVMWRAFVYDNTVPIDRTKQAYNEFKPLDGMFRDNVIIQVKNGPLDFQPREPFHPLFGAMTKTSVMPEFQITQEYLGFSTHLVYLATLFKECLDADTYVKGKGTTVASLIDKNGDQKLSAIAGVTNIGSDQNWCGHHFAQANWYAFGRLAWDHQLTSEKIADEWLRMTFSNDEEFISPVREMMMASRETAVKYMTPLGLHHIMGWSHHYGPAPWIKDKHRADWTSVYYHRADKDGIGFNRTSSGSNSLEQYHTSVRAQFENVKDCPDEYLLWFHHLPWDYQMRSGKTLWDELCQQYYQGAATASAMSLIWQKQKGKIDEERFDHVLKHLSIQAKEAAWWRDACVVYFQSHSEKPIPNGLKQPEKTLEHYQGLSFPYAPGIRPQW